MFYYVYIEEAHPKDGWSLASRKPEFVEWDVPSPATTPERVSTALRWHESLGESRSVKLLVDGIENSVAVTFAARPERLYILESDKVVYRGGEGPRQYDLEEMNQTLHELMRPNCPTGDL